MNMQTNFTTPIMHHLTKPHMTSHAHTTTHTHTHTHTHVRAHRHTHTLTPYCSSKSPYSATDWLVERRALLVTEQLEQDTFTDLVKTKHRRWGIMCRCVMYLWHRVRITETCIINLLEALLHARTRREITWAGAITLFGSVSQCIFM